MNPDQIDELFGPRFVIVWITFSTLALLGIIAVLVWAVRSRQFSDQDHARHLALEAGIPNDEPSPHGSGGTGRSRYTTEPKTIDEKAPEEDEDTAH